MRFRLNAWRLLDEAVVDNETPPGHVTAPAIDPAGNLRIAVFAGEHASEATFRGSISIDTQIAYDRNGSYVVSKERTSGPAEMLAHLVIR